jgi:hypothetical protein
MNSLSIEDFESIDDEISTAPPYTFKTRTEPGRVNVVPNK